MRQLIVNYVSSRLPIARRWACVTAMCIGLFIGCADEDKPNLKALYRINQWPTTHEDHGRYVQPPVVIVPGIMSSTLVDKAGRNIWFGSHWDTLFSDYQNLALTINPTTLTAQPSTYRADSIAHSVLGLEIYGSLENTLENIAFYRYTEPGEPLTLPERRYYTLPYDWRYDNIHAVRALDSLIDQIRKDYNDPNLKVDIIAHSMGGLIARYYMRYGTQDVLDSNEFPVTKAGAKKVRRLIQLGTPNLGSVSSLHSLIEGTKVGFGRVPPEVIATFPSLYQLLPHPLVDWIITPSGRPLNRDLYDVELWRRFQWSVFDPRIAKRIINKASDQATGEQQVATLQQFVARSLERARRFVWSLTVKVPDVDYEIIAFGGNCVATPARVLVEELNGHSHLRLQPTEIRNPHPKVDYFALMLEPGDGSVTKPSLLARDYLNPAVERHEYSFFPLKYAFFLCNEHGSLTANINFQDNLLNALLERSADEMRAPLPMPAQMTTPRPRTPSDKR